MANVKGRNVRVEVAQTFAGAATVTGVSQASPAIVTAPTHGLAQWVVGFFSGIAGMLDLEGQAAVVGAPVLTNSFATDGLDTRNYKPGGAGSFTPASAWLTLTECTSYDLQEGTTTRRDATTILNGQERSKPGLLPKQTLALNLIPQTVPSAALLLLQAATLARGAVLFRITHLGDGSLRVCRGDPSYPTESVSVSAIGASTLAVAIDGLLLKLAGIPPAPAPSPSPAPPPSFSVPTFDTPETFDA